MDEKARHLQVGELGESIAAKYLQKKGFSIVESNFRKKFGEIDIIASKGQRIHFVEVKTIRAIQGTLKGQGFNPLENVHKAKQMRLGRAIQTYLMRKDMTHKEWGFDVVTVRLDTEKKSARVEYFENLVLEE